MNVNSVIKNSCLFAAGCLFAGAVSLALPASSHATTFEISNGRIAADSAPKPSPTPSPKKGEGKCGEGKCGAGK